MKKCNFCGHRAIKKLRTQYIYCHDGKLLVVNNVPCERCEFCGEKYFTAHVLKRIERDFQQIYSAKKKAKKEMRVPVEEYAVLA